MIRLLGVLGFLIVAQVVCAQQFGEGKSTITIVESDTYQFTPLGAISVVKVRQEWQLPTVIVALSGDDRLQKINPPAKSLAEIKRLLPLAMAARKELFERKDTTASREFSEICDQLRGCLTKQMQQRLVDCETRKLFYSMGPIEFALSKGAKPTDVKKLRGRMDEFATIIPVRLRQIEAQMTRSILIAAESKFEREAINALGLAQNSECRVPALSIIYNGLSKFQSIPFTVNSDCSSVDVLAMDFDGTLKPSHKIRRKWFLDAVAAIRICDLLNDEFIKKTLKDYSEADLELEEKFNRETAELNRNKPSGISAGEKYNKEVLQPVLDRMNETQKRLLDEVLELVLDEDRRRIEFAQMAIELSSFGPCAAFQSDTANKLGLKLGNEAYTKVAAQIKDIGEVLVKDCMQLEADFVAAVFDPKLVGNKLHAEFSWTNSEPLNGPPPVELLDHFSRGNR